MFARDHTLPYPAHLVPPPPAPGSDDEEGGEDADVQGLTERVSILWPDRDQGLKLIWEERNGEDGMVDVETNSCRNSNKDGVQMFRLLQSSVSQQ